MAENIEVKALARDFRQQLLLVAELAGDDGSVIEQRDVFYAVAEGRLKLRFFSDGTGELIAYHRLNEHGPKSSRYEIVRTSDPVGLDRCLGLVPGRLGIVSKRRTVFIVGQTRIHLDEVEGLGEFLEIEVVMNEDQQRTDAIGIADRLMQQLGIAKTDLLDRSYLDLLTRCP